MSVVEYNLSSSMAINLNEISDNVKQRIIDDLSLSYLDYDSVLVNKYYYKIVSDTLLIPRYYSNPDIKFKLKNDFTTEGLDIDISSSEGFELREDKLEILEILKKNDHGILQLYTGFGKTVLSVKYITELKKKTLIIVDRDILLDQWKKTILNMTNLKESDIGVYKEDSDLEKPVVLAMVQTLISRLKSHTFETLKLFKNSNFGVTIADEVHSLIGPEAFSDVRLILFSKKLFALSATPFRKLDKETNMIRYTFGDIIAKKVNDKTPTVKIINYSNTLAPGTYKYINFGGAFNYTKYSVMLFEKDQEFVNLFLDNILQINRTSTYKILVPLLTIKSIDKVLNIIETDPKYYELRGCCAKLTSSTKDKYKPNKKVIFSTVGLITKGFDDPDIETLILAIPMGSSENFISQITGRIMRYKEGKDNMMILDFCDNKYNQAFYSHEARKKIYTKLNFKIISD